MTFTRLNKFIAQNGLCSRRSADKLILSGKVFVNNKKVTELGLKIDEDVDRISVEGKELQKLDEKIYYAINKPVGYITTSKDPKGRKKVIDLVPKYPKVYPVGRLDSDSEGLLILTNDGEFTHKMTHPKFEKEKEYEVEAKIEKTGVNQATVYDSFTKGIRLKEGIAKADKINILKNSRGQIIFNITIHQGWNRQIRRMCATVGLDVTRLKRIRIGEMKLDNLVTGKYRILDKNDLKRLTK